MTAVASSMKHQGVTKNEQVRNPSHEFSKPSLHLKKFNFHRSIERKFKAQRVPSRLSRLLVWSEAAHARISQSSSVTPI